MTAAATYNTGGSPQQQQPYIMIIIVSPPPNPQRQTVAATSEVLQDGKGIQPSGNRYANKHALAAAGLYEYSCCDA